MNPSAHLSRHSHSWLRDVQFAVGIIVAIGGAAALLGQLLAVLQGVF
ncbi:MAG: hypothetical protein K2Q19_08560 [Rhodocyclaceae bacterium]|jgi:hypothetical protein|nr:hypothetical protein [Rhodocyclaceae bacterium]